jgi:hypothetical protein
LNQIIAALISQLRKRQLDIEYRGEPDRIYLTGRTENADEPTKAAIKAAKRKLLKDILEPAYAESNGVPVRLPPVAGDDEDY